MYASRGSGIWPTPSPAMSATAGRKNNAAPGGAAGNRLIDICLNRTSNSIPSNINMNIFLQIYN